MVGYAPTGTRRGGWYQQAMCRCDRPWHALVMTRRLLALFLWTYFAWYLGSLVAVYTDGPAATGPIAAALMVLVAAYGWLRGSRRVSTPSRGAVAQSAGPTTG